MLFCKTYGNVLPRQPDHYTTSLTLKVTSLLICSFRFRHKSNTCSFKCSVTSWQLFRLGCLIFFWHGSPQNMHLLLLLKGLSWLGVFCFGYTRIADNFCVVLFSYNSNEVVLVSLDVSPNQYGWTFYKTSLDFPTPFSHSAMNLLHFLWYMANHTCIYNKWLRGCTPTVAKKSKWNYISQICKNWHLNQCTMKVVYLITSCIWN